MAVPTLPSSKPNSPLVSLQGMELAIPSSRSSGESTAAIEWEKPLPPLPLRLRKPSRYSPSDSATMCSSSCRPSDLRGHSIGSRHPNSDESSFSAATRVVSRAIPGRISSRRFGVVDMTPPASIFSTSTRDDDSISIDRLPFYMEWRDALRRSLSSDSSSGSLQSLLMDCDTDWDTNVTITEFLEDFSGHTTGMTLGKSHHEHVQLQNRVYSPNEIGSPVTDTDVGVPPDCARSPQISYAGNTRHESSSPVPGQGTPEESYSPSLYDEQHQPSVFRRSNVNDRFHDHSASSPSRSTRSSYNAYGSFNMRLSRSDTVQYNISSTDSPLASWLATYTDIPGTYLEFAPYNSNPREYNIEPNNNTPDSQHGSSSAMAEGRNSDKPLPPIRLSHELRRNTARHLTEQDRSKRKACHEWSNDPHNPLRFDFIPFQDTLRPARTSARSSARSSGVISTATADSLAGTSYTGSDSSRTVKQAQAVQIASGAVERTVPVTRCRDLVSHPPNTADAEAGNPAASRHKLELLTDLPRNNSIASATASTSATISPSVWSNLMNSAFPHRRSSSKHSPQTPKEVPPETSAWPLTQEPDKSTESGVSAKARLSDVVRGKLRSNKTASKAEKKREELRRYGNAGPGEAGPSSKGGL